MSKMLRMWGVWLVLVAVATTGCHTMEGAGRDVERAGEEVQDVAK